MGVGGKQPSEAKATINNTLRTKYKLLRQQQTHNTDTKSIQQHSRSKSPLHCPLAVFFCWFFFCKFFFFFFWQKQGEGENEEREKARREERKKKKFCLIQFMRDSLIKQGYRPCILWCSVGVCVHVCVSSCLQQTLQLEASELSLYRHLVSWGSVEFARAIKAAYWVRVVCLSHMGDEEIVQVRVMASLKDHHRHRKTACSLQHMNTRTARQGL